MNNCVYYGAFFWIFIAINAGTIAIPTSKLIWVFVEEEEDQNGYFNMKQEQGQFNMEMEMYADIAKIALTAIYFIIWVALPTVAGELVPYGTGFR